MTIVDRWEFWVFMLLFNGNMILVECYAILTGGDLIVLVPLIILQLVAFAVCLFWLDEYCKERKNPELIEGEK